MRFAYQPTACASDVVDAATLRVALSRLPEAPALTVDARMLFHSGIGRYLREVLARWPVDGSLRETYLYNTDEQRDWLAVARRRATFIRTNASIYSLKEQFLPLNVPADSLYWVPHYNLPRQCAAHLIATVHDAAPLVLKEAFRGRVQRLAAAFYFSAVRRTARRIMAVSQFTARELTKHANVAPHRIEVVPNGVDEAWTASAPELPRDRQRLLFVGNLKPHKNLARLVDALELLRNQRGLEVTLEIVGQTSGFRAGLEAETAARLARTPWIKLHGKVDDAFLRNLYAEVGALVFPSLYEGFGLPMLEAMAAGCPVIASSAGALPEVGGPDHARRGSVVYFDPRAPADIARALEYFLRLPDAELVRIGEAGKRRAAAYSWDTTASRTRHVIISEALRRSAALARNSSR